MKSKTLILLPTLNESYHIFRLYKKILSLKLNFHFLFIDDGSIDGTWETIETICISTGFHSFPYHGFRDGLGA